MSSGTLAVSVPVTQVQVTKILESSPQPPVTMTSQAVPSKTAVDTKTAAVATEVVAKSTEIARAEQELRKRKAEVFQKMREWEQLVTDSVGWERSFMGTAGSAVGTFFSGIWGGKSVATSVYEAECAALWPFVARPILDVVHERIEASADNKELSRALKKHKVVISWGLETFSGKHLEMMQAADRLMKEVLPQPAPKTHRKFYSELNLEKQKTEILADLERWHNDFSTGLGACEKILASFASNNISLLKKEVREAKTVAELYDVLMKYLPLLEVNQRVFAKHVGEAFAKKIQQGQEQLSVRLHYMKRGPKDGESVKTN